MNFTDQKSEKSWSGSLNITIMLGGKQPTYAKLQDFAQLHDLSLSTMSYKGFSKQWPWRYWPKGLLIFTSRGTGKKTDVNRRLLIEIF